MDTTLKLIADETQIVDIPDDLFLSTIEQDIYITFKGKFFYIIEVADLYKFSETCAIIVYIEANQPALMSQIQTYDPSGI